MTSCESTLTLPFTEPAFASRRRVRALSTLIRLYQAVVAGRPSPCRFYPTCSTYALEALASHGLVRGMWLSIKRVLKCNPFGPHGIDLVPPAPER